MIVPNEIARRLVAGHIRQVRLPVGSTARRWKLGEPKSIQPHRVMLLATEGTDRYVRYTATDAAIGHVVVIDVRRETLADLTDDDAQREGYGSVDEIIESWRHHGRPARPETPVWVLTVKPHTDPVRLLAPAGSQARRDLDRYADRRDDEHHDDEHDYTPTRARAMPDEPEAVDPDRLDRAWAERAEARRRKAQARHSEEARREARTLAIRTRELSLADPEKRAQIKDFIERLDGTAA